VGFLLKFSVSCLGGGMTGSILNAWWLYLRLGLVNLTMVFCGCNVDIGPLEDRFENTDS
jgi:hypothetical protein